MITQKHETVGKIKNNELNQHFQHIFNQFIFPNENFQNCTTSLLSLVIIVANTIITIEHICSAPYIKLLRPVYCWHAVKLTSSPLRTVLNGILPIAFFAAHIRRLCFHTSHNTSSVQFLQNQTNCSLCQRVHCPKFHGDPYRTIWAIHSGYQTCCPMHSFHYI